MKKTLIFLLVCCAGAFLCTAREYTVKLQAVPGEEQIFFLDLRHTGADSSTFSLTTPDGKKIPFSFDMQLCRVQDKGKYQSSVNGYYSKAVAPSSEKKFEIPGFLSFRAVPGVKEYIFKFKDGAKETLSRPDPGVRGWWIEIMRDPGLKNPRYIKGRKGHYKVLPQGGVECSSSFRIPRAATTADKRIAGRRIFALVRCQGPVSYFTIDLKNGVWDRTSAIACYFPPSPEVMQDICAEGLLASENVFPKRNFFWRCEYVKGASTFKEIHVQLPPIGREMGASIDSDLYNEGDVINIKPYGGSGESAIPFESGSIKGMRYGVWQGEVDLVFELKNSAGKTLLKGKGNTLSLKKVKPGSYVLTVDIYLGGTFAMQKKFPLQVQISPF